MVENIYDVICSSDTMIDAKDDSTKGRRLTNIPKPQATQYSDLFGNSQVLLGSIQELTPEFINQHNIQTVIDCSQSFQTAFVNRVFRPSQRFLQIFRLGISRVTKEGFKDLILSLEQLFDVIRCT